MGQDFWDIQYMFRTGGYTDGPGVRPGRLLSLRLLQDQHRHDRQLFNHLIKKNAQIRKQDKTLINLSRKKQIPT